MISMPVSNVSVIKQSENKLIGRREYVLRVDYDDGTPSRSELREIIASKLGVNGGRLIVVRVDPSFGSRFSRVIARVYDSEELLRRFEPKYLLIREGIIPRPEKK